MRCIYCLRPSADSKRRAHVFPEALAPKGPVLPLGVECDRCNEYAGAKLESVLVRHPLIAIPLQLAGLPGKSGTPRKRLGIFERNANADSTLSFPIEPPKVSYGPDGIRRATITPVVDPLLDYAKFSRALHHIALNLLAYTQGADAALAGELDAARRFVKAPVNGNERWPYIQLCQHLQTLVGECGGELKDVAGARIVALRLYNVDYFVDLVNSGVLLTARFSGTGVGASTEVIGPDWVPPRPRPLEEAPGGMVRHYRVSIE